ncbi:MAG TPA: hypothetical protein VGJ85_08200 [Candidatus Nanopelagicaceae bacterium]|jgi:hypothetical protein
MGKPHAVLAVMALCFNLAAQETIADKCHAPRDPFFNQPMPEQFNGPETPKTARQVGCFKSFKTDSTMVDVVKKCGKPDNVTGSGISIFVYYMDDCSRVTIGTPDLKRLSIKHMKRKKTTVLFDNWR